MDIPDDVQWRGVKLALVGPYIDELDWSNPTPWQVYEAIKDFTYYAASRNMRVHEMTNKSFFDKII